MLVTDLAKQVDDVIRLYIDKQNDSRVMGLLNDVAHDVAEVLRAVGSAQDAAAHSPDECGRECQYYDYFEMLWNWFADESRNGSEDMRANIPDGLSADDFKNMLDEHEAALMADIALKQPEPRTPAECSALPDEEADGKEAIRLLDQWTETEGAEDRAPYQDTMALLGKENSAGWVWAREVRYERDFDAERERTRKLAMEAVTTAEAEAACLRAQVEEARAHLTAVTIRAEHRIRNDSGPFDFGVAVKQAKAWLDGQSDTSTVREPK